VPGPAAGLAPAQLALLNQVQFSIQDLSASGALGLTALHSPLCLLDATAEGWVGSSMPRRATVRSSASRRAARSGKRCRAVGVCRMDLLTWWNTSWPRPRWRTSIPSGGPRPETATLERNPAYGGAGNSCSFGGSFGRDACRSLPVRSNSCSSRRSYPRSIYLAGGRTRNRPGGSSQPDTAKVGLYSLRHPTAPSAVLDRVFAEQIWSGRPFTKELLIPLW